MSEPLETWLDAAIGETREALARDGKPIALRVTRTSDEGRRARWGELYCARVRELDKRRGGACRVRARAAAAPFSTSDCAISKASCRSVTMVVHVCAKSA